MNLTNKHAIILIIAFILSIQLFASLEKQSIAKKESTADAKEWINPYEKTRLQWQKSSFHLHSDEKFFSFYRHSAADIRKLYKENNFAIISISDYDVLTADIPANKNFIPAYEWGTTPNKRHLLSIGSDNPIEDPFYIFSTNENIQWAINEMRSRNSFVVINHPNHYWGFDKKDLLSLSGFNAIEIYTPYGGDSEKEWDFLLAHGKKVNCMASDDLHTFPAEFSKKLNEPIYKKIFRISSFFEGEDAGEVFMRYILLNTESLEKKDVMHSLFSGNYVCIRKYKRNLPDPKPANIIFNAGKLTIESEDIAFKIDFIGQNGKILQQVLSAKSASYTLKANEPFVRANIYKWEGIISTNPVYNSEHYSKK